MVSVENLPSGGVWGCSAPEAALWKTLSPVQTGGFSKDLMGVAQIMQCIFRQVLKMDAALGFHRVTLRRQLSFRASCGAPVGAAQVHTSEMAFGVSKPAAILRSQHWHFCTGTFAEDFCSEECAFMLHQGS